jgi:hypothetical protein
MVPLWGILDAAPSPANRLSVFLSIPREDCVAFKPSVHGWPFPSPPTGRAAWLGLGALPDPDPGMGAGLCWAALDRYLAGLLIPRGQGLPRPGDPLHTELIQRHASALGGIWPQVREWQALSDRDAAFRSRSTWRWIREKLTSGEPVLLTLLADGDGYRRGRAAWHVLATAYAIADERVVVSIYDPALPDADDLELGFSMIGPLDPRLSGDRPVRGFFPVPYDRERPEPESSEVLRSGGLAGEPAQVYGRIAAAANGSRIDLVVRTPAGGLTHYRRSRGGTWRAEGVVSAGDPGLDALQGDPALIVAGVRVHAFVRSYVGDLLHYQRGFGWSAANRTADERVGPRYRLAGRPIPLAGTAGGVHVFGRDTGGRIVHYAGTGIGRWTAERLPGDPIVGDPLPIRFQGRVQVIGVTGAGRVLHWEREGRSWRVSDLLASGPLNPRLRLSGRPAFLVRGDTLYLFARGECGQLVHLRRAGSGHWVAVAHPTRIAGDPVAVSGPGGIHVFATAPGGGLAHRWGETVWRGEDVADSRPTLDLPRPCTGAVLGWADDHEIRVYAAWGGEVVVLRWREKADWVAHPLRLRPGTALHALPIHDPVLLVGGAGRPHLFGTTPRGALAHVEPTSWREPLPAHPPHTAVASPAGATARFGLGVRGTPVTAG